MIKATHEAIAARTRSVQDTKRTHRSADALALPWFTYGLDIVRLRCKNDRSMLSSASIRDHQRNSLHEESSVRSNGVTSKPRSFSCACVGDLRYPLSYRDLEEMMRERGLSVDHTPIYRWVQHYAPELDKRSRPHLKATNDSWRVDETYIKIGDRADAFAERGRPHPHTHGVRGSPLLEAARGDAGGIASGKSAQSHYHADGRASLASFCAHHVDPGAAPGAGRSPYHTADAGATADPRFVGLPRRSLHFPGS